MPLTITATEHKSCDYDLDPAVIALLWQMEERHFWHRARNRWIGRALVQRGVTPPATLLEVGCGSGAVSGFLHECGYAVTGIDTAEPLVRKANERFPDANFIVGDVGRLKSGPFDAVGLFDVLEHLDDPEGMLAMCLARARPGTVFAATVPAQRALRTVIDDLSGHKKRYEVGQLAALLDRAGLVDVEERGIFRATAGLQKLSRRHAHDLIAAELSDDDRRTLWLDNLDIPAAPVNFALGVLCSIEQATGFGRALNRAGASLLATGRVP